MKSDWIETCISEIAVVQSGAGFPDRYQGQVGRDIPFYKVSDMNIAGNEREMFNENNSITEEARHELRAFLFPAGSTIFPKIGGAIATNKKRLTTRPCCVDNNVMGVVPRDGKIDSQFLFYFFLKHDLSEFANEAHLPSIKKTVVESWPITLPASLREQRRIVAVLDEAFEGIATAKANTEKNLQNAHELFDNFMQSQFAGRGPGWTQRTLEDVCKISSRLIDPREPEFLDLPHIGAGNIESKSGAVIDVKTSREEQLISGKFLFDEQSVLYSKIRPYLMKVLRPTFSGICSADIYPLVPKTGQIDRDYLYYMLLAPSFTAYAIEGSARAGMPKVNREHLFAYRSFMPAVEEQARIAARLDAVGEETRWLARTYHAKLSALEELKKSLLHQAFTGALTAKATARKVAQFA